MMDLGGGPNSHQSRLVGDYILGPRIGLGSFAVVWRSRHRQSGDEVAVKEIDKKQLSPKISQSLLKEISILSTINHPNIIRLQEAIETEDKIYLVLEYCEGGDLAGYIHRHGKVSEAVARHFMRHLAAGLQVLQEKHLIHRDLKPQNLLLSSNESIPLLKIGDFGFARSLTPQCLADTLCGSPLYMAPEIIQNKKYNAKADLWSVGAILFQLVTGRPPFDGNSQFQLFQNILTSTELQFPNGALEDLHPYCVDLCRSLLRQNPVERLTFKEFFTHKFLMDPRPMPDVKQSSLFVPMDTIVERSNSSASDMSDLPSAPLNLCSGSLSSKFSTGNEVIVLHGKDGEGTSGTKSAYGLMPNISSGGPRKCTDQEPNSSNQCQVFNSMESIEKDYVLVNAHSASLECISCYPETSMQFDFKTGASSLTPEQNEQGRSIMSTKEPTSSSVDVVESSQKHEADLLPISSTSTILRELQGLSILHPSTRIRLLRLYVQVLAEVSLEKYNAGLFLESFSVELVILAIWKKARQICSTWLASTTQNEEPGTIIVTDSKLARGGAGLSPDTEENIDFARPSCVSSWAEKSFLVAFNRAEKLSHHIHNMDGTAEMPDAMEIIFQKALAYGTSGAQSSPASQVVEFVENNSTAAESYSKALCLLLFIAEEETTLSLNPPFSLTPANKKRIQHYITNLNSRHTNLLKSQPSLKQFLNTPSK